MLGHRRKEVGLENAIVIGEGYDLPGGMSQARITSTREALAWFMARLERRQLRLAELPNDSRRVINGTVVDNDDLAAFSVCRRALNLLKTAPQILCPVP